MQRKYLIKAVGDEPNLKGTERDAADWLFAANADWDNRGGRYVFGAVPTKAALAHLFSNRARNYAFMHLLWRRQTYFFAAAGWINALLAKLTASGLLTQHGAEFLAALGAALQTANERMSLMGMRRSAASGPEQSIDSMFVRVEQMWVEEFLVSSRLGNLIAFQRACGQIDALLNSAQCHS